MAEYAEGYSGISANGEEIIVSIVRQECSDRMSDFLYSHAVYLKKGEQFYTGCCGSRTLLE